MKKIISLLFATLLASTVYADTAAPQKNTMGTQFISYWFSWGQDNPPYHYPSLLDIPDGVNMVFVAFGLESDKNKLVIQIPDPIPLMVTFKRNVQSLRNRGIKVILSTGGAVGTYPWDVKSLTDQEVADQYCEFLTFYHLDGLDFDVESGKGERIPHIVELIKQKKPDLMVSLTVGSEPSQSITPDMQKLGAALYANKSLDYLNLMNYDQNWTPPTCSYEKTNIDPKKPEENCYLQNVIATRDLLTSWTHDENKAKQMLSNGIMIGRANDGKIVTPELAKFLTTWLKANGYGAVMTWGLSRDQPGWDLDKTTGVNDIPAEKYTKDIIEALK